MFRLLASWVELRTADWRDGEALAKLYEAGAVVEIRYRGPDGMELLGTLSGKTVIDSGTCPRRTS